MNGLIMGGGQNTRLPWVGEKLTISFGIPMICRVLAALEGCSDITSVYVATSPHAPKTRRILRGRACIIETAGEGYSKDMAAALAEMSGPTLIVPGDMPLLDSAILSCIIDRYDDTTWTTILVSESIARHMGVSEGIKIIHDTRLCRYTGVSMVNATQASSVSESHIILDDARLVVNVNSIQDCILLGAAHYLPMH